VGEDETPNISGLCLPAATVRGCSSARQVCLLQLCGASGSALRVCVCVYVRALIYTLKTLLYGQRAGKERAEDLQQTRTAGTESEKNLRLPARGQKAGVNHPFKWAHW